MGIGHRLRIIIVEDEPAILRYIRKVIEETPENYEIVGAAGNGREALQLIYKKKPELIITDIMMPLMTGLELIEECRKELTDLNFIILTGYEKFEYARQAMTLGVTSYLLKPIDSDELKKSLKEINERITKERRLSYLSWLRNSYLESGKYAASRLMKDKKLYLNSVIFGSIGSSLYCTYHKSADVIAGLDFGFISEIEELYDIQIFHFPGNYQNEYVFAMVMDSGRSINLERIRIHIFAHLKNSGINVTLCSCGPLAEAEGLEESIREIYLTLISNLKFGRDSILSSGFQGTREIRVSEYVMKQMASVSSMMKKDEIKQVIERIAGYWEDNQVTQLILQTDLRYILQYCLQNSTVISEQLSDVSDMVYYSYDYNDLKCTILYETDKIFSYSDSMQMKGDRKRALSEEVKNYLDKHFTEQITFKDFSDLMGYNEKYITSVFKEQIGVSPSRYVLERRIKLAKKLLKEKPDIILKEVSELVGYSDPLYFSRVFKASVGISPSTFAKQNKKGE